jgi:hypothetical protein
MGETRKGDGAMSKIGWVCILVFIGATAAFAGINIPSDGSDGQLYVTNNTCIDLALAVTTNWDANNGANAGKGVYDSNKWAVVFKYTNVFVGAGATVTFSNHPSRAPVVWLVNGSVTIEGTVSVDGGTYQVAPAVAEPGPGGFRGGIGRGSTQWESGAGFGVGGGTRSYWSGDTSFPMGGSYGGPGGGGLGGVGQPIYGNASLVPLIGGSGGAGHGSGSYSGGGGGGAILIACGGTLLVSGTVRANGGGGFGSGGGSGGGIRLVADSLSGPGTVSANGPTDYVRTGGAGRIRVERVVNAGLLSFSPSPSEAALQPGATPVIWPPTNAPTVRIVSVGGTNAPADPRAIFGQGVDVRLPETNCTMVVVETVNVEQISTVKVRLTPRGNADYLVVTAGVQQVVSPDPLVIRWTSSVPVQAGFSAVQVQVIRP